MVKTIEDLAAVLKICRKQGISEITIDGITMRFHAPQPEKVEISEAAGSEIVEQIMEFPAEYGMPINT